MNDSTTKCPKCGHAASGLICEKCGASLSDDSRRWVPSASVVAWTALALSAVSLVVSLSGKPTTPSIDVESGLPAMRMSESLQSSGPEAGGPPDLSALTPREAADRLFNRVMMAGQQKNDQEVRQFSPMALAAYARVGELDNDARYHLALIHLATGDTQAAQREIDLVRKSAPGHLLAFMIEHEIATRRGDRKLADQARTGFNKAFQSEMARQRVEYADHQNMIERFHRGAAP